MSESDEQSNGEAQIRYAPELLRKERQRRGNGEARVGWEREKPRDAQEESWTVSRR